MVVAAEEVVRRCRRTCTRSARGCCGTSRAGRRRGRRTRGSRDRPRRVVDPVVRPVGGGERGDGALRVVGDHRHVGGEERLVVVVHARGDVGPPEERLGDGGAVEQAHARSMTGAAGTQADAVHALHAVERVVVGAPDRDRAVVLVLDGRIHRQERAGRWCCGQLNSTPPEIHGPARPDERRLDHVVAVEEVVRRWPCRRRRGCVRRSPAGSSAGRTRSRGARPASASRPARSRWTR